LISVRSEVQVLPGPPFLHQVSGAVAQLGEHLLCKQGVVGSIPSGSTISAQSAGLSRWCREDGRHSYKVSRPGFGRPRVLHDIVKRRFVRTPWLECGSRLFRHSVGCASMALVCRGETLNLPHMMGCLTAPPDGSREAGLFVPMTSSEIPHRI
jgi:hypothetical protein